MRNEARAEFQLVRIDRLKVLCNPYNECWMDIDTSITFGEITKCLEDGAEQITDTEYKI